jgi:hypothetical protein
VSQHWNLQQASEIYFSVTLHTYMPLIVDFETNSIPGSQCDAPSEHRSITVIDESADANVECKSRMDTGSNQELSPQPLMHPALASPEPVTETAETPKCCHESEDIEMGNPSPEQQTNFVNPDLETENQS